MRAVLVRRPRVVVAALVAATLAWVVLASPLLAVHRVVVSGAARTGPAAVLAAAAVREGTPLARADVAGIRMRVDALAAVDRVDVERSWPSTLRLVVHERVAVAGLLEQGSVRLLDRHGVVFASAPSLPDGVVRLQVDTPDRADPATRSALQVLSELPDTLRKQLAIVRAARPDAVTLLLRDGRQVLWGPPGRTSDKAAAAMALLRLPGSVYDVSSPDVVMRRQATGAGNPSAPTG